MVYIYAYRHTPGHPGIEELADTLPAYVVGKSKRFVYEADRQAYLAGKLLLKTALEELDIPVDLNEVLYSPYGRPYVNCSIDFNISHSGDLVVCCVSTRGRVGIDVELAKPIELGDFKSCFQLCEWNEMTRDNNINLFYRYWTMKEAAIKADGRGFSLPLSEIRVEKNQVNVGGMHWNVMEVDVHDARYKCHLATREMNPVVEIAWKSF